ncbi:acetate--CoA ligase family protein [Caenibius sp. WL]|uniref:acetate--CoA ligase family protein n=1 Tax=Caenibius sp. WL TaxID=2872646 RepID=UPI001C990703|nr:acetate--CoA ligase family protein [Caenibius sp. WL]QZP08436.1 acetate--CoA ligase family protein [Caenibius sp. WL]
MSGTTQVRPEPGEGMAMLRSLLDPQSVAIIGATPELGRIGGIPLAGLLAHDFPRERILLVNPKYDAIEGIPCYPDIASLPWTPDLAIVAVVAPVAIASLYALDTLGVPAAVVFAAGFGEDPTDGGARLEAELRAFLAQSTMHVAGPNTMGVANIREGICASFLTTLAEDLPKGPLALIGQSGNSVSMMAADARDFGLGMSYFVSTGNETSVEFSRYCEHFLADPGTGAVLGYCEQLRDGPAFLDVAVRLREAGKPMFLAKVGRSDKAREATLSHTGAMAGNAAVHDAVFGQLAIAACRDPAEVMDMARLWATGAKVTRPGVCIVSLSGAGCAFLADMFADAGVPVPSLSSTAQAALSAIIPSYGMVSNPIDLTGNVINDMSQLRAVMEVLATVEEVDCIVIYIMGSLLDAAAPILMDMRRKTDKLIVALDPSHAQSAPALRAAGVEVFTDSLRTAASLATFLDWRQAWAAPLWRPRAVPPTPMPGWIADLVRGGRRTLNEAEVKRLLADAGISVVSESVAVDEAEALRAADAIGYPVALKLLSNEIAHKSDIGGVELGIGDTTALRAAWARIMDNAQRQRSDAAIEGMVVQAMAQGPEFLIGLTRDATFGAVLTVGLGGVYTELFRDVSLRVLPVDRGMVEGMLAELRCAPLLEGYRGQPQADREALVSMILALADFFERHPFLAELELNPVIVGARGCTAVDGLAAIAGQ